MLLTHALSKSWQHHDMETLSALLSFCEENPPVLQGKYTGDRWIPITKGDRHGLWCLRWCSPIQIVEQTVESLVIWDAMMLPWNINRHHKCPVTRGLMFSLMFAQKLLNKQPICRWFQTPWRSCDVILIHSLKHYPETFHDLQIA